MAVKEETTKVNRVSQKLHGSKIKLKGTIKSWFWWDMSALNCNHRLEQWVEVCQSDALPSWTRPCGEWTLSLKQMKENIWVFLERRRQTVAWTKNTNTESLPQSGLSRFFLSEFSKGHRSQAFPRSSQSVPCCRVRSCPLPEQSHKNGHSGPQGALTLTRPRCPFGILPSKSRKISSNKGKYLKEKWSKSCVTW